MKYIKLSYQYALYWTRKFDQYVKEVWSKNRYRDNWLDFN